MIKIPFVVALICFISLLIVLPTLLILFIKDQNKLKKVILIFSIIFVVLLLFCTTVDAAFINNQFIFTFKFDYGWFAKKFSWNLSIDNTDLFINSTMLIPLGATCLTRSKNKLFGIFISCIVGLIIGIGIEFIQFALPISRSPQFMDTILNCISATIGAVYFYIIFAIRKVIYK